MTYQVRNNYNNKVVKNFENLEEAVKWCDKQHTKGGHMVTSTENGRLVRHYDTFEKAKSSRKPRVNMNGEIIK